MVENTKKVIFRADASATIGFGHFSRLMALAEMLRESYQCVFATRLVSEFQKKEIYEVCDSCIELPESNDHFYYFLNLLTGNEIIVLDNYFFSSDYQLAIKSKGCRLVCIDDLHDKHFYADLVINQANNIHKSAYIVESYTQLLLGYKYLLLRKNFLTDDYVNEKKYSCLLMIGGSDPFNLTRKFLIWLKNHFFNKPIVIIIGSGYQFESELDFSTNVHIFRAICASKVAEIMLSCEFGILPASTSALEACALRLPFVCGYFIDNQLDSYISLSDSKVAVGMGDLQTLKQDQFNKALTDIQNPKIYHQIKENQIRLVDRKAKGRFLKEFKLLCI